MVPAFGRPYDKLRDTHQLQFATLMDFARDLTRPASPASSGASTRY